MAKRKKESKKISNEKTDDVKSIDCLLAFPRPTRDSPLQEVALSIFCLGAYLEKRGFVVDYIDERFDPPERVHELAKKALAIGVSTMTGFQLVETKRILLKVREDNPGIITIVGGVHPTLMPSECIKQEFIDFVVMREGEQTLYELMSLLKKRKGADLFSKENQAAYSKIQGLVWKKGRKIGVSKDRSKAGFTINPPRPFMDTKDIPFPLTKKSKRYFEISGKVGELSYQTSRGCPNNCNFCYNQIFNQSRWRPLPIDKIEKEVDALKKEIKFSGMMLIDDNLGPSVERMRKVGDIMRKNKIRWHVNIRCNYINDHTAKILEAGNCESLLLGVESGSDRILKEVINKGYPNGVEDIKTCARALGKTKVRSIYSFMCNIPTETKKELRMSMKLADYIDHVDPNSRISFYVYAPYPGTRLFNYAIHHGYKEPKTFEEWSKFTLSEADPHAENIYYIAGLRFRSKKGDRTDQNFPGWRRLKIKPFEMLCRLRWRLRFFSFFSLEKAIIKRLIQKASQRVRKE